MTTEQTVIRHPTRGKAHRLVGYPVPSSTTACGRRHLQSTEQVPLSQTAPEDRCKTCWPTKEDTK